MSRLRACMSPCIAPMASSTCIAVRRGVCVSKQQPARLALRKPAMAGLSPCVRAGRGAPAIGERGPLPSAAGRQAARHEAPHYHSGSPQCHSPPSCHPPRGLLTPSPLFPPAPPDPTGALAGPERAGLHAVWPHVRLLRMRLAAPKVPDLPHRQQGHKGVQAVMMMMEETPSCACLLDPRGRWAGLYYYY